MPQDWFAANAPGNIDVRNRSGVKNPDGTTSTVRTISINEDGREVLIPTVIGDRVVSDDEAIQHYRRTGEHLGRFSTPEEATSYAERLHNDEAKRIGGGDWFSANAPGKSTDPASAEPEEPGMFSWQNIKDAAYKASPLPLFERQNLPMTLGGIGAGVGGPAGAAVGGAAGTALRDIIGAATGAEDVPTTPVEAFTNVAGNAAAQGALTALPVGRVLQGGANRLTTGLLKAKEGLRDSFGGAPAIAETLLQNRVPISEGGLRKIQGRLGESRGKALEMVREAEKSGATNVKPEEIVREFEPVVTTLRKRADIGQTSELPKVGERGRRIIRTTERGTGIQPVRAQQLKEEAQEAASGAYRARERGNVKQLSADDMLDEATARGFQKAVEARAPSVGAQNQQTQALLGGTRALEDALGREANTLGIGGMRDLIAMGAGAAGGAMLAGPVGAVATPILMRLLSSPSAGSRAAIAMYEAGKLPLDQLLRSLAIEAHAFGDEEPDQ